MPDLVLLRHGESEWNHANRYTGWTDVDLTVRGEAEARQAGKLLAENQIRLDWCCTSLLRRAIRTLWLVLDELQQTWVEIDKDWHLNERHYGALQGLNKAESTLIFGREQVFSWRRSFNVRPPQLQMSDSRHPRFDVRYHAVFPDRLPAGESLADTQKRVLDYWADRVAPALQAGKNVLLVAHGNSLRALVTYLNHIDEKDVPDLTVPTGIPLVYHLDEQLNCISSRYLAHAQVVKEAEITTPQGLKG